MPACVGTRRCHAKPSQLHRSSLSLYQYTAPCQPGNSTQLHPVTLPRVMHLQGNDRCESYDASQTARCAEHQRTEQRIGSSCTTTAGPFRIYLCQHQAAPSARPAHW